MINTKRYVINYTKFVTERIPEDFRFPEVIALALIVCSPIIFIYNLLILLRNFVLYNLSITPQVAYLEKMLNDRYDDSERRIYILDGNTYDPLFIYTEPELQPQFLYTEGEVGKPETFLYTEGEVSQFTFDFVVYVPLAVSFDETEMKTRISSFKLASKFFKIQKF
jgi:hypothetical protein